MKKNKQLVEITNGKVSLNFHEGQAKAWNSKRRFIFVIAGTQGGKTSFGPWWLWRETGLRGPGDYLAATSSYDLFKLKMLPEMRNVFEHILQIGRYWSGDKIIELKNPETGEFEATRADGPMYSRIILRSASAEGGLESATAKGAWLDEVGQDDFSVGAWQAVRRRVSLNRGRILGTTTPYNLGWMKQQVYDPWLAQDPLYDVIQFASTMNPLFSQEEMELARQSLPTWKYKMFYLGQFERPAGLIYNSFIDKYKEQGGHKVEPFPIPSRWPRIVGVDPGAANLAMIWLAHDTENDVYYLYRERHGERLSTPDHVGKAVLEAKNFNERIIGWFIGTKSESQQRMDWQAAGARPVREPTSFDVESGIDQVIKLFRQHRLYVFDECIGTLDELSTYSRVLDSDNNPTKEIKDKSKYHRLDALRYGAAGTRSIGVLFS